VVTCAAVSGAALAEPASAAAIIVTAAATCGRLIVCFTKHLDCCS
jgi:hypothetical protein